MKDTVFLASRCYAIFFLIYFLAPTVFADVVTDWNKEFVLAIKQKGIVAPIAARQLAILHIAIFDAINGISRDYDSYLPRRNFNGKASVEAAASAAAYRVASTFYPDEQLIVRFDRLHDAILKPIREGQRKARGLDWGIRVANEIMSMRANDGSGNTISAPISNGPGSWLPTPPDFTPFQLPHWGYVVPFTLKSGNQFRPASPPRLASSLWAKEFNEVKNLGAAAGSSRTAYQTDTAIFWDNAAGTGSPPAHWNLIAADVAHAKNNTLIENARLFALLNLAMADSAIAAWDAKYHFNFWRPVTAIHHADTDFNRSTKKDINWSPLLETPPFPDYVSGHSTFSGAAASILADFFGTDSVAFSSSAETTPPITITYTKFSEAAAQAAESRLLGGIHFRSANERGLKIGQNIGRWVYQRYLVPRILRKF